MKDTLLGCLCVAVSLWMLCTMVSGCDQSSPGSNAYSDLSPQQARALDDRLAKAGFPIKYDGPMTGTSGYLSGREGILLFDRKDNVQTQQSAEVIKRVVDDFLNQNGITGFSFVAIMGSDAKTRTIDLEPHTASVTDATPGQQAPPGAPILTSQGTSLLHYSYASLSFDYPSYMTVPDKKKFDVEKVRDMLRPSGVEILTILMSADMNTGIQVARTKRDISFDALYQEKKSLADEINKAGIKVMGDQYTKFTVERTQLSGNVPALSEYGEKANGEVAVALEFLNKGYDCTLMFIYKSRSYAQSGAKDREKVVKSIKIKSNQ